MSRPRADSAEEDYQGQGFNKRKKARLNGDHLQSDHENDDELDATKSEPDLMWLSDGDDGDDCGADLGETGKKANRKPWKVHRPKGDMHDANLYRYYRPDFRELAKEYPDTFGVHVKDDPESGRATIDWKSPEATRELTRVMLRHDFGLEWDVPLSRLCPPVPNRLNYICWLADIMKLRPSQKGEVNDGVPQADQGGGVGTKATLVAANVGGGYSTARATSFCSAVEIDDEADGMASERRPIGEYVQRYSTCRQSCDTGYEGIDAGDGDGHAGALRR